MGAGALVFAFRRLAMRARVAYRSSLAVACVCALVNVVVLVRVWLLSRSPVNYNVRVVEPMALPAPPSLTDAILPGDKSSTNLPLGSSLDVGSYSRPSIASTPTQLSVIPYSVGYVDGSPILHMNRRFYRVGDVTAFGVIDLIFPERVYFRGGDYIANVQYDKFGFDAVNTKGESNGNAAVDSGMP